MSKLIYPLQNETVKTHTDLQTEFIERIARFGTDSSLEWLLPIKNNCECSYPAELTVKFEADGLPPYEIILSESKDIAQSVKYLTDSPSLTLENLKVGCEYFVFIGGEFAGNFKTADEKFRFIRIDGLLNVRDLGGINIKQGMLYRGSDIMGEYSISEKGKKTFRDELGIKTELNLRREVSPDRESPMPTIPHVYLPYRPYMEIFEEKHREGICKIFDFLADENNYPVYFHCLGGADRTGMIALYLRALLGESDEDILIDYELTSLSTYAGGLTEGIAAEGFRNRNNDYFREFLGALSKYSDKKELRFLIPEFLSECGVKKETLEKIISILKI